MQKRNILAIVLLVIFAIACKDEENINKNNYNITPKSQININTFCVLDTLLICKDVEEIKLKYNIDMRCFVNDNKFKNILTEIKSSTEYFYQHLNNATEKELEVLASFNFVNDFNDFSMCLDNNDYENAVPKIKTFSLLFFNENITQESLKENNSALVLKTNETKNNIKNYFDNLSNSYNFISKMNDEELAKFIDVSLQYYLLINGNNADAPVILYAPPMSASHQQLMHNAIYKSCYESASLHLAASLTAATVTYTGGLIRCSAFGPAYLYCAGAVTAMYGYAVYQATYTYNVAVENCRNKI